MKAKSPRRKKQRRLSPAELEEKEEEEEEEEEEEDKLKQAAVRPRGRSALRRDDDLDFDTAEDWATWPDEDIERILPFCCYVCKCSRERKEKYILGPGGKYISPSEDHVPHRVCCHRVPSTAVGNQGDGYESQHCDNTWVPGFLDAMETLTDHLLRSQTEDVVGERMSSACSLKKLMNLYESAKKKEAELFNNDHLPDIISTLQSSEDYLNKECVEFDALAGRAFKKGCTVLDTFAGAGSGIMALKRARVAISKVVYCEIDKVATHVFRHNHDTGYNSDKPDDDIEYVYYRRFETIERKLDQFMQEHAPIDVVLGGPPCSDFSRVNAYRQGIDGAQGQYLERLGKLVTFIQRHELQRGKKVFFLVENVLLSGDDLHRARQAFGVTFGPLEVDAMYVSPCHRRRFFFTNIKQTEDFDYGAKILPETCLEDGYQLGSTYVDPDTIAHCNTFMASLSRIDDERMDIFKKQQQPDGKVRFVKRKINVSEREKMMGYPVGYVSDPINMLYKTCLFALELDLRSKNTGGRAAWMDKVPPNLHPFAGNYHAHQEGEFFEFEVDMQQNALILKMAPPVARNETKPSFFTSTQYAKHLIGNAYSVVVAEHLLKSLSAVYGRREYEGWAYQYEWDKNPTYATLPAPALPPPPDNTAIGKTPTSSAAEDDSWAGNRHNAFHESRAARASPQYQQLPAPIVKAPTPPPLRDNNEPLDLDEPLQLVRQEESSDKDPTYATLPAPALPPPPDNTATGKTPTSSAAEDDSWAGNRHNAFHERRAARASPQYQQLPVPIVKAPTPPPLRDNNESLDLDEPLQLVKQEEPAARAAGLCSPEPKLEAGAQQSHSEDTLELFVKCLGIVIPSKLEIEERLKQFGRVDKTRRWETKSGQIIYFVLMDRAGALAAAGVSKLSAGSGDNVKSIQVEVCRKSRDNQPPPPRFQPPQQPRDRIERRDLGNSWYRQSSRRDEGDHYASRRNERGYEDSSRDRPPGYQFHSRDKSRNRDQYGPLNY